MKDNLNVELVFEDLVTLADQYAQSANCSSGVGEAKARQQSDSKTTTSEGGRSASSDSKGNGNLYR